MHLLNIIYYLYLMERLILNYKYETFFNKIGAISDKDIVEMKQHAIQLNPENYGEISDLVARFKVYLMGGMYIHASKVYENIRMYYAV